MAFMLSMNWSQELLRMRVSELLGDRARILGTYQPPTPVAGDLEQLEEVRLIVIQFIMHV